MLLGADSAVRVPQVYTRALHPPTAGAGAVRRLHRRRHRAARRGRRSTATCLAEQLLRSTLEQVLRHRASSTPIRTPATSSPSTTAASASSTSARSAGSTRSSSRRSSTCSPRSLRRDVEPPARRDRTGRRGRRTPISPEQLERALARLMADHVRVTGAVEPTVLQDLVATLARVRHPPPGRPRRALACARHPRRHAPRARAGAVARRRRHRDDDVDDGAGSARPRRDDPRRAPRPRSRTCGACRIGSTASSRSPSRGELRIRSIVDEDGRRILRTLVNRALLVAVGAAFLVVAAVLLVAARPGPDRRRRHRPVRDLRLLRSARRHGAPAPGGRRRHQGWDDMTSTAQRRRSATAAVPRAALRVDVRPPGDRYFRHPGDVVRLVALGRGAAAPRAVRRVGHLDQPTGVSADLGRAAAAVPLSMPRAPARAGAGRRRRVPASSSSPSSSGSGGAASALVVLAAGAGAGLFALLDAAARPRRRRAGRGDRRHLGGVDRLPVARLRRRRRRRRHGRQALARRGPWRRGRRPQPARCSPS